ncbi:hypothetical protein [Hyphomicrobium sp.]|jgi:hypothetical protein|uniref:hypothetical protein n=1 Tax=Hyphomicrobium sp. TaxID=82 RepID=UPI002CF34CDA|nr:hypothetical protein [Hyphomicrobium sp.]HVZ04821.1 hypothetical protein [Hyphomicrobium sp.]
MRESKIRSPKPAPDGKGADGDVCAGQALGFPLQSALGFLPIETLTLNVFRCVCDVYATASATPWDVALRFSEEQLGPAEGPLLVARITALLRALRKERAIGFSYLSAGCQHVSPDELTMTGLLKAARSNDKNAFERGIALALDNAEITDATRLAVRCLAEAQSHHVPRTEKDTETSDFDRQTVQAVYLH